MYVRMHDGSSARLCVESCSQLRLKDNHVLYANDSVTKSVNVYNRKTYHKVLGHTEERIKVNMLPCGSIFHETRVHVRTDCHTDAHAPYRLDSPAYTHVMQHEHAHTHTYSCVSTCFGPLALRNKLCLFGFLPLLDG